MHGPFGLHPHCAAIVAIPACDEERRIGTCLSALAVQRDAAGAPLDEGRFAVVVFANNCRDATADRARSWGALCPFPLIVVEAELPPEQSNAGWARKIAMDRAAGLLEAAGLHAAAILTTDADSRVGSAWMSRTLAEIAGGADAVAGYIEAEPAELIALGEEFTRRGRLEDRYLACMAEILALCDPLPYDPWPRHRVASGASMAVTLAAYRAIGGLPPLPLGEDVALAAALVRAGFKVRHALDIVVITSCRLDGRAEGGAADTMKLRRDDPDAPCDADMEPLPMVLRRAAWRRRLRAFHADRTAPLPGALPRLGLGPSALAALADQQPNFESFWALVEARAPALARLPALRPSLLPREIERARRAVALLRRWTWADEGDVLAPVEHGR